MKISIDRSDLLRSLSHVQSAVDRRNTVPILSNVKLETGEGSLTLSTTDMDMEITETVGANVGAGGATTVRAATFYDIIRKLPDGSVDLSLEPGGSMLSVKAGRSSFKLSCLPVADFPEIGTGEFPHQFSIPAAQLRELIDRTRFAISTDETRYYLTGIYLHEASSNDIPVLRAVATDGHRLARFEMPLPQGAENMPGVILPRKMVGEIYKLAEEAAADITISVSANKIRFAFDHIIVTSKLIDGTYPDYQKVIPQNNDKIVEVDPKAFSSAIDRVSTISSEKTRAIKLSVDNKTMTLASQSPDAGSATEDIEVSNDNLALEIGFNSSYLLDITRQLEGDQCRIVFADANAPTIIQDAADASSLYVLMPLRV